VPLRAVGGWQGGGLAVRPVRAVDDRAAPARTLLRPGLYPEGLVRQVGGGGKALQGGRWAPVAAGALGGPTGQHGRPGGRLWRPARRQRRATSITRTAARARTVADARYNSSQRARKVSGERCPSRCLPSSTPTASGSPLRCHRTSGLHSRLSAHRVAAPAEASAIAPSPRLRRLAIKRQTLGC
jgi:hypothetical protein